MAALPTTPVEHPDGETFKVAYEPLIQCEHCDYTWGSTAESPRPTCPGCGKKTDYNEVGKHFHEYQKYAISDKVDSLSEIAEQFHQQARKFEAMDANGWEFDDISNMYVSASVYQ